MSLKLNARDRSNRHTHQEFHRTKLKAGIHHTFIESCIHRPMTPLTVEEYLAIRKSYQEDVRLGIFTAKEARAKIEELDKARRVSGL